MKSSAKYGIAIHKFIELYLLRQLDNFGTYKSSQILKNVNTNLITLELDKFLHYHELHLLETEYSVKYKGVNGKIDAIFINNSGNIFILDWKTVNKPKSLATRSKIYMYNFNKSNVHEIQLNVYRYLLERMNFKKNDEKEYMIYICYICGKRSPKVTFHQVGKIEDYIIENILNYQENAHRLSLV